jgi:hypothetical protein
LPVRIDTQPWFIIPSAFLKIEPFSSANATTSSNWAIAAA